MASVDLGSNSFRLMIGRVESSPLGDRVRELERIKRTVRLATGLREDGTLDAAARDRGLLALASFGERLRLFAPQAVRAVATSTLRTARNAAQFLRRAEAALGFPIEVLSGTEEARLVYQGAAHSLPRDGQPRLVIDIGGGSTECIVGTDLCASTLGSADVGCVTLSKRHFVDARIDGSSFESAYLAARAMFAGIGRRFDRDSWRYAVGTSGTTKSLWRVAHTGWAAQDLDRGSLARIRSTLLEAGSAETVQLPGLEQDRRPVLAGGLATMMAAFDEFGIDSMRYCSGALLHGVLHDLLGRDDESRGTKVSAESAIGDCERFDYAAI